VLPSRRKHVVFPNLPLCFLDKTEPEYDDLALNHFRHVVRSYLERGIQWFRAAQPLNKHVEIDSKIDLHDKNAPPTIFMGFHFVAIEVGCILYSTRLPAALFVHAHVECTLVRTGQATTRQVRRRND
jgi:KDO2-lipid IV(A) lauroyltransferase